MDFPRNIIEYIGIILQRQYILECREHTKVKLLENLFAVWEEVVIPYRSYHNTETPDHWEQLDDTWTHMANVTTSVVSLLQKEDVSMDIAVEFANKSFKQKLTIHMHPRLRNMFQPGGVIWRAYMYFAGSCHVPPNVIDLTDILGVCPENSVWSRRNTTWEHECLIETGRTGVISAPGTESTNYRD